MSKILVLQSGEPGKVCFEAMMGVFHIDPNNFEITSSIAECEHQIDEHMPRILIAGSMGGCVETTGELIRYARKRVPDLVVVGYSAFRMPDCDIPVVKGSDEDNRHTFESIVALHTFACAA